MPSSLPAAPRGAPVSPSDRDNVPALGYSTRQRLRGPDVRNTLASGRRFKGRSLTVQVRSNAQGIARLGLIVPKRCLPRAVDRNRAKRVLREWFRIHQAGLKGRDVLVRLVSRPHDLRTLRLEMSTLFPEANAAPTA